MRYTNPILRGFYPDPSICRVGDDYYMVTSSFEFAPGVPLFHSKNLVSWTQIGHCLVDESEVDMRGCCASHGIYAPTIRYHEGRFYMITTNVGGGGHLICHTDDPSRGWSKPVYLGLPGIDPSLLFDAGHVYFTSTGEADGRAAIMMCELDPITGKLLTEPTCVSFGCGGKYPEAPHLYHIGDYYYLMLAEGGTEYGHRETILRGTSPYGPYEPCPNGPILTHRDRMGCNIQATGHADLLEDANGNWWLVCLAIRTLPGVMLHNLGRETFLAPVSWVDGWPVVGNAGEIDYEMSGPLPQAATQTDWSYRDDFTEAGLDHRWAYVRNPEKEMYSVAAGKLKLKSSDALSTPKGSPAFVGIRQPEFKVTVEAVLDDAGALGRMAGLSAFYSNDYHYDLCIQKNGGQTQAFLRRRLHDVESIGKTLTIDKKGPLRLCLEADEQSYQFYIINTDGKKAHMGGGATAGLCTECTNPMSFTGVFTGLFCEEDTAVFSSYTLKAK